MRISGQAGCCYLFPWTAFHRSDPKGALSNRFPAFSEMG
jgi:hypothetical protein